MHILILQYILYISTCILYPILMDKSPSTHVTLSFINFDQFCKICLFGIYYLFLMSFSSVGVREQKFTNLKILLQKMPLSTKIHFEMASFSDLTTTEQLVQNVLPYADSLGMNEQELPNLVSILTHGSVTHVSDSNPRVATILDKVRVIYRTLRDSHHGDGKRALTRLHVHTLAFQAILTKKDSIWKNTMSAAAKASLTAHRYICGTDKVDTMRARLLMDDSFSTSNASQAQRIHFQSTRPVACWTEEDYELCVAPVLVCTKVLQTAGGGDNISSAGLVLQI